MQPRPISVLNDFLYVLFPLFATWCGNDANDGLRPLVSGHSPSFDRPLETSHEGAHRCDRSSNSRNWCIIPGAPAEASDSVQRRSSRIIRSAGNLLLAPPHLRRADADCPGSHDLEHRQDSPYTSSHRPALFGRGGASVRRILFEVFAVCGEYPALIRVVFGSQKLFDILPDAILFIW